MTQNPKRIAIIADWLIDFGGAELVISHLLEIFPDADIYTSVCFMDHPMLKGRRVYTSWLQRIPFLNRRHKLTGILRPWAFRSFDLSGYDIVICSSSAESKQVAMGKWNCGKSVQMGVRGEDTVGTMMKNSTKNSEASTEGVGLPTETFDTFGHKSTVSKPKVIVYCHTPIRYYWSHYEEYRNMMEFGILNPIARFVLDSLIGWLRKLDYEAAQRVDYVIANSKTTQERIKSYYNRESTVIYPGVDIDRILQSINGGITKNGETEGGKLFESDNKQYIDEQSERVFSPLGTFDTFGHKSMDNYYISIGRCIPYKKFDLLVDTFNKNGKSLILVTNTDNKLYQTLREKSKSNITWKFRTSQEDKNALLRGAKGFLFPPLEDFGLVPLEAMALGIPVLAYGQGGATETVIDGINGVFFEEQTIISLTEGLERFEMMNFDKNTIKTHAEKFDKKIFQKRIIDYINTQL